MQEEEASAQQEQTIAIHAGDRHNPSTAIASPIYQSATYGFDDPADIAEAMAAGAHPEFYGRYGSPNTKQVEQTLAELEGGEAALATGSGMAAISLVMLSLLKSGDHIIAQHALYPTTHKLITKKLPSFGIDVSIVNQTDTDSFADAIRPNTKIIYIESPANPVLSITDVTAVSELARSHGLQVVADNTFATPINQKPLSLGCDVVVHSATKYLSGHSDVVAGIVISSRDIIDRLWKDHVLLGSVLHPFEAWLLERGLKTIGIRMEGHNSNGLAVAQYLNAHPAVEKVFYPGLLSHPQAELIKKQMHRGYGGMVSFELIGGKEAAQALLQRLNLVSLAVSLGGAHSLITHPASTISTVQTNEETTSSGVRQGLVRLSVGLEDKVDIVADLSQALAQLPP